MTVLRMTVSEWREWFKMTTGRYPTLLDTYAMNKHMENYDGPVEEYEAPAERAS